MIEKYFTSMDSNRWIDNVHDFVNNHYSSSHSSIKKISERFEPYDEVDLISNTLLQKEDFVQLLNKRGAFEKEGQRFTGKTYLVTKVGLNSVWVLYPKFSAL